MKFYFKINFNFRFERSRFVVLKKRPNCFSETNDHSDFLPYIFASNRISLIPSLLTLIKTLSEKNLLASFPDTILTDFNILIAHNGKK